MSRDDGRDSQMEFLKVDDFVDGVVGIVWFDGQCLDCVAFQIRSHGVGRWLWGLGWDLLMVWLLSAMVWSFFGSYGFVRDFISHCFDMEFDA